MRKRRGSERVVVIEDDVALRTMVEHLLVARGYRIVSPGDEEGADADLIVFGGHGSFHREGAPPAVLVLEKPFSVDDLERQVRAALDARGGT